MDLENTIFAKPSVIALILLFSTIFLLIILTILGVDPETITVWGFLLIVAIVAISLPLFSKNKSKKENKKSKIYEPFSKF